MSLVDITDFDAELRLLGLYEREVMRTGILDYPAQWPLPQPVVPTVPEPKPLPALPEAKTPVVHEPVETAPAEKTSQATPPAVSPPVNNIQVIIPTDELPVPVTSKAAIPEQDTENLSPMPCPLETRRQDLLTEQERERRLFYLFAEELERTGDLRKFPAVLYPTPRP